jgi:dienelactone hydrolase
MAFGGAAEPKRGCARSPDVDDLADFACSGFSHDGVARAVYRKGTGPAVLVMHEVPGISAEVARFARKVADAGFTVFMPHLFGVLGAKTSEARRVWELAKLCVSREWHVLAENRSSPVADWLRALARHVHAQIGGRGVGVVGMCVTGNFALTMTLDDVVVAPVMAHPSFPLPVTPRKAAALHVTPETLDNARRRIDDEGLKVLGVRFTGDVLFCRRARFETLRRELGHGFEAVEVPGRSAKPHPEPPHSVLTIGLVDREGEPTREAVDRVIGFLGERLSPKAAR